jgi:outer membrane protein assembly factor BamB
MVIYILALIFWAALFSGCTKKYRLKRDESIPPSQWSYVRGDRQSRATIDSDFRGELNLRWEEKISESPIGPLNIVAGNLVVCGTKGRAYFYNLSDGKYRGRIKIRRPIQTGLTAVDSLAYFSSAPNRDKFICLNLHNRDKLWQLNLKDVTGPPIIIENYLYLNSASGRILCLKRFSGEVVWEDSVAAKSIAGPSGDDKMVYFPLDDGSLKGYDAKSGTVMFKSDLGQPLVSKAVVDKMIFVSGIDGGLFAINRENGKTVWRQDLPFPIWTAPALDDDRLFIGDNGGVLRCLKESDGSPIWEFSSEGVINSSPIVVGDYIIFASLDRFLYCLEKDSGNLVSRREFKKGIRFPAISDGRVICVVAQDGTIQCFGD